MSIEDECISHSTPHPSDETLVRAVDGELPPSRRATLEAHLAICDGCRARMETIRSSAAAASAACLDDLERSAPALEEMRTRLRITLADRSAALDRSWRVQAALLIVHVPIAAVAAA